jgi:phosphohistidine phosphatase
MRLILLRHAKSEKATGGSDHDRSLNPRGKKDSATIGAYLAKHQLVPDLAVVSTARRTRETWERVVAALTSTPPVRYEKRLYNASAETILAVIKETDAAIGNLLVIGHYPGIHDVARALIASGDVEAREQLIEGLPTSGLAVVDFAARSWRKLHDHGGRLDRFVTPRLLALADTR